MEGRRLKRAGRRVGCILRGLGVFGAGEHGREGQDMFTRPDQKKKGLKDN